ncbi:MAG: hypothetical protein F4X11_03015 [Acidobacteria bacterium]|nr:hypothetical protein [Acidobacteriota bacterium]
MLHVLGEIHESARHLIEQQLLLGAGKRPPQRDEPVELIDRHQGRTPRGAYQAVERADDLPARNLARADGMRARLVNTDFQPLEQRVANVLVTKVLAVGQDERKRHIHGDPIPGPATEMRLQASTNVLQVRAVEGSRHQVLGVCSLQPHRIAQTVENGTQLGPSFTYLAMQRIHVGERQTVPEPARGARLKENEDLALLDYRMANASQKVRLADSRPSLDDQVADRHVVAQPSERIQDLAEHRRMNAVDVDDVVAPNVVAGGRRTECDVPECSQF